MRKPTITKSGRVPSCSSTQRPTSTPTRVVTRSEMPISEKRAAYAQPRPGSIMGDLTKRRQYSSCHLATATADRGYDRPEVDAAPYGDGVSLGSVDGLGVGVGGAVGVGAADGGGTGPGGAPRGPGRCP